MPCNGLNIVNQYSHRKAEGYFSVFVGEPMERKELTLSFHNLIRRGSFSSVVFCVCVNNLATIINGKYIDRPEYNLIS